MKQQKTILQQPNQVREALKDIVTRKGTAGRIPEMLELELDQLEALFTKEQNKLLDSLLEKAITDKRTGIQWTVPVSAITALKGELNG